MTPMMTSSFSSPRGATVADAFAELRQMPLCRIPAGTNPDYKGSNPGYKGSNPDYPDAYFDVDTRNGDSPETDNGASAAGRAAQNPVPAPRRSHLPVTSAHSTISASQMSASQLTASQLPASQLTASQFPASQLSTSQLPAAITGSTTEKDYAELVSFMEDLTRDTAELAAEYNQKQQQQQQQHATAAAASVGNTENFDTSGNAATTSSTTQSNAHASATPNPVLDGQSRQGPRLGIGSALSTPSRTLTRNPFEDDVYPPPIMTSSMISTSDYPPRHHHLRQSCLQEPTASSTTASSNYPRLKDLRQSSLQERDDVPRLKNLRQLSLPESSSPPRDDAASANQRKDFPANQRPDFSANQRLEPIGSSDVASRSPPTRPSPFFSSSVIGGGGVAGGGGGGSGPPTDAPPRPVMTTVPQLSADYAPPMNGIEDEKLGFKDQRGDFARVTWPREAAHNFNNNGNNNNNNNNNGNNSNNNGNINNNSKVNDNSINEICANNVRSPERTPTAKLVPIKGPPISRQQQQQQQQHQQSLTRLQQIGSPGPSTLSHSHTIHCRHPPPPSSRDAEHGYAIPITLPQGQGQSGQVQSGQGQSGQGQSGRTENSPNGNNNDSLESNEKGNGNNNNNIKNDNINSPYSSKFKTSLVFANPSIAQALMNKSSKHSLDSKISKPTSSSPNKSARVSLKGGGEGEGGGGGRKMFRTLFLWL